MEYLMDNFIYCDARAGECSFSCKTTDFPSWGDSIDLMPKEHDSGVSFTLDVQLAADIWHLATGAVAAVVVCVTNAVFFKVRQVVRRAAAVIKPWLCNQRGGCRGAYKMLMALRL